MSKKLKFSISGMTCVVCAETCRKAIQKLDGVSACNVNFASGIAITEYDETKVSPKDIMDAVNKAGYKALFVKSENQKDGKAKLVAMLVLAFLLLIFSMAAMLGIKYPSFISMQESPIVFSLIQILLCVPVMVLGFGFYIRGFKNLFTLRPNMDSLVAVSTTTAFVYSFYNFVTICMGNNHNVHNLYFESVAVIIAIISLGKYLEGRSLKKTGDAIKKLTMLTPDKATILKGKDWVEIDAKEVKKGDIVLVKAGESFCCDGIITEGESDINESMLTGESLPVDKKTGDKVFGGTVNGKGIIVFRAESVGEMTKLSNIIRLVEEAQNSKAPIARIADKVSGVFVPIVIVIAIISSIIWRICEDNAMAIKIFVGVLVVACPCALGLATPTAIITGIGRGAKAGVLFKNAESLEKLSNVDTIVVDKTGTITKGQPVLTDWYIPNDEKNVLAYVRAVESVSEHPLARAVVNGIKANSLKAENVEIVSGQGIIATIEGKKVLCGNQLLLKNNNIDSKEFMEKAEEYSLEGKSIVFVAVDKKTVGVLAIADTLKDDALDAITELKKMKLRVILLSGDNKKSAGYIAKKAGIDEVIAEVLPEEKSQVVDRLTSEGAKVAMVGDGINDAPALAKAHVGIAMGGGSDIAIESGQVVIVGGQPMGIVRAVELSKATMRNVKQNLFWAFIYNIIGIPIACGVLYPFTNLIMNPMIGGLAMSLSSVSVVSNALRLNFFKFKHNSSCVCEEQSQSNSCEVNSEKMTSCPIYEKDEITKEKNDINIQNEKENIIIKRSDINMKIKVEGMMCSHCENRINKVLSQLDGVKSVKADHLAKCVDISFDESKISLEKIKQAIKDEGYEAE